MLRLLRQTGGRFNEIVLIRLDQFHWTKGHVRLEASKTENERDIPLWGSIHEIVQARIREGLTDGVRLSGHKTIESFSIYLRPTDKAGLLATHAMENVDGF